MKKQFILFTFVLIIKLLLPDNIRAQTTWIKTYGGSQDDFGRSVQQTVDGGYIIAGTTNSFGAVENDIYLIKTNAEGDTLWTKTYGEGGTESGKSVQQTSDGGYIIAGYTNSFNDQFDYPPGAYDIYLIKTDTNGDTLWTRTFGGTSIDYANSIQLTNDGGYIITGVYNLLEAFPGAFLIKTDSIGNNWWIRRYGDIFCDEGYSVQQTIDGGYIIAGNTSWYGAGGSDVYLIKTDSAGDTLWTKTYGRGNEDNSRSVQQTSDGGYIIAGYTDSYGAGGEDCYLVKTDANGDTLWTRTYGGSENERGECVHQTSDGGYIIAGYTDSFGMGGEDFYLIKTDASGDTMWTRRNGGQETDKGFSVQQTTDGGYIIAGETGSFGSGNQDMYLIKTDAQGLTSVEDADPKNRLNTFKLLQNYPNPFNPQTTIEYKVPELSLVKIEVYNTVGQKIKTLVNQVQNPGTHQAVWNTLDDYGNGVSTGLYFYVLKADGYIEKRKMVHLK